MPFLSPNQQRQSTEGIAKNCHDSAKKSAKYKDVGILKYLRGYLCF